MPSQVFTLLKDERGTLEPDVDVGLKVPVDRDGDDRRRSHLHLNVHRAPRLDRVEGAVELADLGGRVAVALDDAWQRPPAPSPAATEDSTREQAQ